MADFQTQVEALTGLTETTRLTQYLKDGVIDVQNKVIALRPEDKFYFQRVTSEIASNDSETVKGEILSVVRQSGTTNDWRDARPIPPSLQSRVTDINSIHYASKFNPAYTVLDNGKINVFPNPSSDPNTFKVYYINTDPKRDSDAANIAYGDSDIRFFPKDKVYLVVLYAASKVIDYYVKAAHDKLPSDLIDVVLEESSSLSVTLDTVSESLPSYTAPGTFIQPISLSEVNVDFSDVGSIETFVPPIYSEIVLDTIPDMSLPVTPTAPSISLNDGTITGTAPVYVQPTLSLTPNITLGSLDITAVAPISPSLSDNSVTFSDSAPAYNKPTLSLDAAPTISDLNIKSVAPIAPDLSNTSISFTETAPSYVPPVLNTPNYGDVDTWINTEEDPEMAKSRLEDIQTKITQFQAEVQNSVQSFTEQSTEYTTKFQQATQDAQLSSKDEDQKVQLYMQQLQEYQVSVNKELQEYTNNMNKDIKLWESKRLSDVQEFTAKVQDELNEFNSQNSAFQVSFQKAVQNAQLSSADDQQKIALYQQDLVNYSNDINKIVQEYQIENSLAIQLFQSKRTTELQKYQADIQSGLNKFNEASTSYQAQLQIDLLNAQMKDSKQERDIKVYAQDLGKYQAAVATEVQRWTNEEFNKIFGQWKDRFAGRLQQYNTDLQKETSRVAASVQDHQAKTSKALQAYQVETGYDMAKYQAEVQSATAKFQSDLAFNTTDFQNNLANYNAEVQKVASVNQNRIAKYNADIQKIAVKNQNKLTKYGAEVQNYANQMAKVKLDVDLYQQRALKLEKQYTEAFMVMAPRQQQGGEK
tara:strand:- start:2745 stop:5180 length:2436 start_codon:yes stop_codon:yes gene_type:complete